MKEDNCVKQDIVGIHTYMSLYIYIHVYIHEYIYIYEICNCQSSMVTTKDAGKEAGPKQQRTKRVEREK